MRRLYNRNRAESVASKPPVTTLPAKYQRLSSLTPRNRLDTDQGQHQVVAADFLDPPQWLQTTVVR
jgi:hypothetical protein